MHSLSLICKIHSSYLNLFFKEFYGQFQLLLSSSSLKLEVFTTLTHEKLSHLALLFIKQYVKNFSAEFKAGKIKCMK